MTHLKRSEIDGYISFIQYNVVSFYIVSTQSETDTTLANVIITLVED